MSDVLAGDVEAFRNGFAGRVVTGDDADYDGVRAECVWNGDIDRRPWIIARATSAADVAAAVGFARASGREIAVRGGGHNFAGSCIADKAVMIDLGAMCDVVVDPAGRNSMPRRRSMVLRFRAGSSVTRGSGV
jgi:FAD/FMN-containing dehydrogenase